MVHWLVRAGAVLFLAASAGLLSRPADAAPVLEPAAAPMVAVFGPDARPVSKPAQRGPRSPGRLVRYTVRPGDSLSSIYAGDPRGYRAAVRADPTPDLIYPGEILWVRIPVKPTKPVEPTKPVRPVQPVQPGTPERAAPRDEPAPVSAPIHWGYPAALGGSVILALAAWLGSSVRTLLRSLRAVARGHGTHRRPGSLLGKLLARAPTSALARLARGVARAPFEYWRAGTSHSLLWSYLPGAAVAAGVSGTGLYTGTKLATAVHGIGEMSLYIAGLGGSAVGFVLLTQLWSNRSERAVSVLSLLGTAASYAAMAVLSGPVVYLVASFSLGMAALAVFNIHSMLTRWLADHKVGFAETLSALALVVITVVIPGTLSLQGALLGAAPDTRSLGNAVMVSSAFAVGAAVVMWAVTPPTERSARVRQPLVRQLSVTVGALRDPFTRRVAAVTGWMAMALGTFDGVWRAALASMGATGQELGISFGLVVGSLVVLAIALIGDLTGRRIRDNLAPFLFLMSGLMLVSGLVSLITQQLGVPVAGIWVTSYLGEAGSTGMLLAVAIAAGVVFHGDRIRQITAVAAATLVKVTAQLVAALTTSFIVSGATPLPGGWAGAVSPLALAGAMSFYAAWQLWRHHLRQARPTGSPLTRFAGAKPSGRHRFDNAPRHRPGARHRAGRPTRIGPRWLAIEGRHRADGSRRIGRGERAGHSGALFSGYFGRWKQRRWHAALPELAAHGIRHEADPARPRGPPILEIPLTDEVQAILKAARLTDLPARLLGYHWAPTGEVVIFTPMLKRLREAGLLERVLAHEDEFHRLGRTRNAAGLSHRADARRTVRALLSEDFHRLWWGKVISDGGAAVSSVVLPLAAERLGASTLQISLLTVLTYGASLLVTLPAGALAARVHSRLLMIATDLVRFALTLSVPIAAFTGALGLGQLYLVTGLSSALFAVYTVAATAYLPRLLGRGDPGRLTQANASLLSGTSTAQAAGPMLGGTLAGLLGAATTMLLDAASYLFEAVALSRIRTKDVRPAGRPTSMTNALRQLFGHPILRPLALYEGSTRFAFGLVFATQVVYLVRYLQAPGWAVGVVSGVVFLGGLLGATWAPWAQARFGGARVLLWVPLLLGPLLLLYPLATPGWLGVASAALALAALQAVARLRAPIAGAYLQSRAADRDRAQLSAANRLVTEFGVPFGALLGGLLGTVFGLRGTALLGMAAGWAATLWLLASPLRGAKNLEGAEANAEAAEAKRAVAAVTKTRRAGRPVWSITAPAGQLLIDPTLPADLAATPRVGVPSTPSRHSQHPELTVPARLAAWWLAAGRRPVLTLDRLRLYSASTADGSSALLVVSDAELLTVLPTKERVHEADDAWAALIAGLPRYANARTDEWPAHQEDANRAGVFPTQLRAPAAELPENEDLHWALRPDGSGWIAPARGEDGTPIQDTVVAGGGAILAGGGLRLVRVNGTWVAVRFDVRSAYHADNRGRPHHSRLAYAVGRALLARHAITVSPEAEAAGTGGHWRRWLGAVGRAGRRHGDQGAAGLSALVPVAAIPLLGTLGGVPVTALLPGLVAVVLGVAAVVVAAVRTRVNPVDATSSSVARVAVHRPGRPVDPASAVWVGSGVALSAAHVVRDVRPEAVFVDGKPVLGMVVLRPDQFDSPESMRLARAAVEYAKVKTRSKQEVVDLVLLITSPGAGKPLRIAPVAPRVGDTVTATGFPWNQLTVGSGTIIAEEGAHYALNLFLGPGSSGGPVVDRRGDIVAIASFSNLMTGQMTVTGAPLVAGFRDNALSRWAGAETLIRVLLDDPARGEPSLDEIRDGLAGHGVFVDLSLLRELVDGMHGFAVTEANTVRRVLGRGHREDGAVRSGVLIPLTGLFALAGLVALAPNPGQAAVAVAALAAVAAVLAVGARAVFRWVHRDARVPGHLARVTVRDPARSPLPATGVWVGDGLVISAAHAVEGLVPEAVFVDGRPVLGMVTLRPDQFDSPEAQALARRAVGYADVTEQGLEVVDLVLLVTQTGRGRPGAGSTTVIGAPLVDSFRGNALRRWLGAAELVRAVLAREPSRNALSLDEIRYSLAWEDGVFLAPSALRSLVDGMDGFAVHGPDVVRGPGLASARTPSARNLPRAVESRNLHKAIRGVVSSAARRVAAVAAVTPVAWVWPAKVTAVAGFALVAWGFVGYLKGRPRGPSADIAAPLRRARNELAAGRLASADRALAKVESAIQGRLPDQPARRLAATHRARLLMSYPTRGPLRLAAWWRLAWPLLGELAATPAERRDPLDEALLNMLRHNLAHRDFDGGPYWDFLDTPGWVRAEGERWAERTVRARLAAGLWQATTGPNVPAIPVVEPATLLGLVGLWLRDRRVPAHLPVRPREEETTALRALLSAAADELVKGRTTRAARLLAVVQVGMRRVEQPDKELDRLLTAVRYTVEAAAAEARTTHPRQYLPSWLPVLLTFGGSVLAQVLAAEPGLRRSLPEPFDLFSHAGNLGGGWAVGMLGVFAGYFVLRTGRGYLTGERLRTFRSWWVPGVLLFTAVINAFTEVRWMVEHIGVAHALFGSSTVADPLDLVYSVAIAGLVATFGWHGQDVRAEEPANGVLLEGALDERQLARFESVLPGLVRHATVRPARDGQWPVLEIPRNRSVRAQLRAAGLQDVVVPPLTYHWADRGQLVKIVTPRVERWVGRLAAWRPAGPPRGTTWVRVPHMQALDLASGRLLGATLAAGALAGVTLNLLGAGWVPVALGFTASLTSILVPAWRAEPVEGRPGRGWARLLGWLGHQLRITLPALAYGVGSGVWVGGVLTWLARGVAWLWGNLHRSEFAPPGAKLIRVPLVDPLWSGDGFAGWWFGLPVALRVAVVFVGLPVSLVLLVRLTIEPVAGLLGFVRDVVRDWVKDARAVQWVRVPRTQAIELASDGVLGGGLAIGFVGGVVLTVAGVGWLPTLLVVAVTMLSGAAPAWEARPRGPSSDRWAGWWLRMTLPALVFTLGSGFWWGSTLVRLVRVVARAWRNGTADPLLPPGAKVIRVPVVDPVWLTGPSVLIGAAAFAGAAVLAAVGYVVYRLARRPGVGHEGPGGAIAVELPVGRPVAQTREEYAAARTVIAELLAEFGPAPLPQGHPDYRLADPGGRWAAHQVPFYVLPGLNRRWYAARGLRRVALVMFVAPGPDGAPSVFIDPLTLARLHRLTPRDRSLLADRELARILHPAATERAIQAMPLPEPATLRALVTGTNPGLRKVRASDDLQTAVELAASVVDHLANTPGHTMPVEQLLHRVVGDIHDLEAAVGLHPWLHIDDVAAWLLPLTPPVTPAVAPTVSPAAAGPPAEPAGGPAATTVIPVFGRAHLEPVTEQDGAGARIHRAIELYLEVLDEAGLPLDPAVRKRFVGLLEHIREHIFWDRNGGATAIELDAHLQVPVMWLAPEDLAVKATNLAEVAALLGFRLDAELMGAFAVVWHELGHVLQFAYGWDTGATGDPFDTLARHSLAAGMSAPLLVEPNSFTTVLEVESERLAEGLASLLLVHYLTTRFELTRLQSHYLPTVLRSVMADGFWRNSPQGAPIAEAPGLPGYLHYHGESAVRAVLSLAAPAPNGGGVVRGGLRPAERQALEQRVLRKAITQGHTRLVDVEGSPPLRVLDEAGVRPLLERVGMGDLPSRMLDYAWTHRWYAPDGEMVMFADTARTVLANPALLRWLQRHNRTFHLGDHPNPHGAEHEADAAAILEEWDRIRAGEAVHEVILGEFAVRELTALRAEAIAEEWRARLAQTDKPQVFQAEARELRLLVVIAGMLLRGHALDESWPVGPVRFYLASDERFGTPGVDPVHTSDVVITKDGTRHIYAADPLGLLYRVVAELGRARGETHDRAMWNAELALRLVDQRELAGLPRRVRPDRDDWTSAGYAHTLARLARTDAASRIRRVIAADERVARIERDPEPGPWQRLHSHHAGLRWSMAVRAARSGRVDEDVLRREHAAALTELRGLPGLTEAQRRVLDRASSELGSLRVSHALRVLRTEAEFDHLRLPDARLLPLVVRNLVWGDLLSDGQLPGLAELRAEATRVLLQGAPRELRMLLVERRQEHGRLVEPEPPADGGGNQRLVDEEYRAAVRELAEASGPGPAGPVADPRSRVAVNLWTLRLAGSRASSADLLPLVVRNIVWGELTAAHPVARLLAVGALTARARGLTALLTDPAEGSHDLVGFQPPGGGDADPPAEIRVVATERSPELGEPTTGRRASLTGEGISVLIGPEGVTIGAEGPAPSVALGDPSLADPHATITPDADGWTLTAHADTTVAGEPVTGTKPLADGARLRLGDVELTFRDRPEQRFALTGPVLAGLAWFGGSGHIDRLSVPVLLASAAVAAAGVIRHLVRRGRIVAPRAPPKLSADRSEERVGGTLLEDRHQASMRVLARDKEALEQAMASTRLRDRLGRRSVRRKLEGIKALEDTINHHERSPLPKVYLLEFDTIGRGHAVVAFGNPYTSKHVVVYVPGMGNRLQSVGDGLRSARRLWNRAALPDNADDVAVIAHWGFDQPQNLRQAMSKRYAVAAAPKLHRFLQELRATGREDMHLTLLSHSYGSVISAITALLFGLSMVQDWIVPGSPGVHARHVSLLLREHDLAVWVATAIRDLLGRVTPTFIHGIDPTNHAFGARRFDAGTGGRFGGKFGIKLPHLSYWKRHSPALANMALIITDRREQVRLVAGRSLRTWWGPKRTYRIREMGRHDGEALEQVFAGMSDQSRYTRYFGGTPRLTNQLRRNLLDIDGRRHVAFVAEIRTKSGWQAIGIVRFVAVEENRAEIAAELVDEWQSRGVATRLLRILGEEAIALGYTEFIGEFLPANRAVRRLLDRVFPDVEFGYDGGHSQVRIPLGPRPEPRGLRRWSERLRGQTPRYGLHAGMPLLGAVGWGSLPHHVGTIALGLAAAGLLLFSLWDAPRGRDPPTGAVSRREHPVTSAIRRYPSPIDAILAGHRWLTANRTGRIAVLVALGILAAWAIGETAAQLAVVLPMFGPRRPDDQRDADGDAAVAAYLNRAELTDEAILDLMREAAVSRGGRALTRAEWEAADLAPSASTLTRRWGTWSKAWTAAGFASRGRQFARKNRVPHGPAGASPEPQETKPQAPPADTSAKPAGKRLSTALSRDEARTAYALYTGAETGQPLSVDLVAVAIGVPAETVRRSFEAHGLAMRDYKAAATHVRHPSEAERLDGRRDPHATDAFEPEVIESKLRELAAELGHSPTRAEWRRAGLAPNDTTIHTYYGSWSKAQVAAGLPTFRASFTDEQVLAALAEAATWVVNQAASAGVAPPPITWTRYERWAFQRPVGSPPVPAGALVASRFGGFGNAVRRLAETGTRRAAAQPPPAAPTRPAPRAVTDPSPEAAARLTPQQAVIWELYWDGLFSSEEIASMLGTTVWRVRKVFLDVGQPRRTKGEARQLRAMVERAVADRDAGRIVDLFRGTTGRPGMTPVQIAGQLGEDLRRVYAALRPVVANDEFSRRYADALESGKAGVERSASPDKPLAHTGLALAGLAWLGGWPSHVTVPVVIGAVVLGLLGYAVRRSRGPPETARSTRGRVWSWLARGLASVLVGVAVFSSQTLPGRAGAAPSPPPYTATVPDGSTAGREAAVYGTTFTRFNAANGGRFTGPKQPIGGRKVNVPADWNGIMIVQSGDSLWTIFMVRHHDRAGYLAAYRAARNPDLIYRGQHYRVLIYRPVKPVKPTTPVKPVKPAEPPVDLPAPVVQPVPWTYPAGLAGAIVLGLGSWLGTAIRLGLRTAPKHRAPAKQRATAKHRAVAKHRAAVRYAPFRRFATRAKAGWPALRDQLTISWAGARVTATALPGLWRRLVGAIGWDMPIRPGHRRAAMARLSVGLVGFGAGLAVSANVPVAVGALIGGTLLAARVRWSAHWLPAPRYGASWRSTREARAVGYTVVGMIGALTAELTTHSTVLIRDALRWVATKPESTITVKTLISALVVSAVINYRSVKNRRTLLRERGVYTTPRRDAWHSAVRASAVAWVSDLLALAGLPVLVLWIADLLGLGHHLAGMIPAVLAAALGSAVQMRQRGGERAWYAIVAGAYAVPTFLLLAALGVREAPANWGDYLHDLAWWFALVAPSAFVSDYLVAAGGWFLLKRIQWVQYRTGQNTLTRAAGIGKIRRWHVWLQRTADRLKSDLELFGRPDWAVTALRLDNVLGTPLRYLVLRQMPGIAETGVAVGLRTAAAFVLVMVLWPSRDTVERWQKALGSLSPRSMGRRDRPRGPLYRVTRRIDAFQEPLAEFLAATRVVTGEFRLDDPELARRTAERLVKVLSGLPPGPLELDLVDRYVPELAEATKRVRERWVNRHNQHLRALALTVLMVASNRDALFGALTRISGDRAAVLAFLDRLLEELIRPENLNQLPLDAEDRRLLGLPADQNSPTDGVVIRPIPRRVWEQRLVAAMKERHRRHLYYLQHDLLDLLFRARDVLAAVDRTDPRRRAIDALTARAKGQLQRERHRKVDNQGMVVARALLGERIRALARALVADEARIDVVSGLVRRQIVTRRIKLFRRLKSALTLLDSTFAVLDEVELHPRERRKWRQNIGRAAREAPSLKPGSLLAVLLTIAGAKEQVTAAELVRRHVRTTYQVTEQTWQRKLQALADLGLLEGTPRTGYQAIKELRLAWRDANPRLRHAMRTNPATLPGGEKLAPLLRATLPANASDAVEHAHRILLDLLSHGTRVYRYHTPGFRDDWMRAILPGWSWWRGALYQRRHPLARVERLEPARQRVKPERELRTAIRRATSRALTRTWRRAELAVIKLHRARRYTAQPNAPPHGRSDLRAVAESQEMREAYRALNEAVENRLAAYEDLRTLVKLIRKVDEPEPGARSARLSKLLLRADRLLDYGPSRTREAPPSAYELRRALAVLKAAKRKLRRLSPDADAYDDALQQARVALVRFAYAVRAAEDSDIEIQWGPRWRRERGERLARRLVEAHPRELAHVSALTTPPVGGERRRITGADATFALSSAGSPRLAAASMTGLVPGAGNEDAVEAHLDPASGVITVVMADGLGSGANAALASRIAVRAALDELIRTDLPARTRDQAHLAAAARAGARVATLALPGEVYQPAATYLAVQVFPARPGEPHLAEVITSNLGDTGAYLLLSSGGWSPLTEDHTNPRTGGLVAFLGDNPRVRPTITHRRVSGPTNLVLATRGLTEWDTERLYPGEAAEARVREIARRVLERSGLNNFTMADIPLA